MTIWRSKCGAMELRCGDWAEVLADVETCDAVIADPPYGERTHAGQRHGRFYEKTANELLSSRGLGYSSMSAEDVQQFVSCTPAASGWFVAFSCHALRPAWASALEGAGRYVFAPVACVQHAQNVRLAGDGPSNWATWLTVARWRTGDANKWGSLRGAYVGPSHDAGENALDRSKRAVAGGKPLWLMRQIIRDYSRKGDLIVDPCAGGGTTLLAAALEGRRAIGAEIDPETFDKAVKRLSAGYTPQLEGLGL